MISIASAQRCLGIFLTCLALQSAVGVAWAKERRLQVDDILNIAGYGAAESDPSGDWFVYERLRPYSQSSDFSFRTYAYRKTGHQLWRVNTKGQPKAELLPGLDPSAHSYLQGFSGSGRFLAVMQYHYGKLILSAYDMRQQKLVSFNHTPAFSRAGQYNPIWISDSEMVFAALPENQYPEMTSVRAHTGKLLWDAWWKAWMGNGVSASELRARPKDASNEQEEGELILANANTGSEETIAKGLFADLRVSPNGRWIAALSVSKPRPVTPGKLLEGDPRQYALSLIDINSRKRTLIAENVAFYPYTITWSADSSKVAAFGWNEGESAAEGRFHVVDVSSSTVTTLDHEGLDLASERERGWLQRPERAVFLGDRLAVYARQIPRGEPQGARFTYRDVYQAGLSSPDWYAIDPRGTSQNLTGDLQDVKGIPIHSAPDSLTIQANDGAYRIYSDGRLRRLTPKLSGHFEFHPHGTFATRSNVIRPDFDNDALFTVTDGGTAKIVLIDLRAGHEGEHIIVDAPDAKSSPLAGSLSSGAVLFQSGNGLSSSLLLAAGDGLRELDKVNTQLEELELGTWKLVTYEAHAGGDDSSTETLTSCVLLPPDFRPESPPPLVVDVYPNIRARCESNMPPTIDAVDPDSPYLWAARGYAYARISAPKSLINTPDGPIAHLDELVDLGISAIVDANYADPHRLVLYGYSQGGMSALYVAAFSTKFAAVIAMNSWADLFSHYFGSSGVYSVDYGDYYFSSSYRYDATTGSDFGIGKTPFEDPEIYYKNSPVFLAPQIDAPVLLIHSDMDFFPMYQFDEMFGALKRAGKDARYVRYWGEGHGPSSPPNIRDMWSRFDDFLGESGVSPDAG